MSLPYYKLHPSDITGNYKLNMLSPEAFGVFARLFLVHAWVHEGKLPDDDNYLAGLANIHPEAMAVYKEQFLHKGIITWLDDHLIWNDMTEHWVNATKTSENKKKGKRAQVISHARKLEEELKPKQPIY